MPLNVKDGSVWKEIKNVFVNLNGVWKEVSEVFIKENDLWKIAHKSGFTLTLSSDTNINLYSLFVNEYGSPSGAVNITVIIPTGVIIGGVGSTALTVGNFPSGSTINLINQGSIQGFGGSINGGTGGDAINTSIPIFIDNQGTIYGGGGGGGKGGDGGQGATSTSTSSWVRLNSSRTTVNSGSSSYSVRAGAAGGNHAWINNRSNRIRISHHSITSMVYNPQIGQPVPTSSTANSGTKTINAGGSWNSGLGAGVQAISMTYNWLEHEVTSTNTTTYDGGLGGNGGQGTGFSQARTNGSQGTQGGTNAGSGGSGGNGGAWGASGAVGVNGGNGNHTNGTSGQAGGLAGHYIVGNANVTWVNQGTVAGRAA